MELKKLYDLAESGEVIEEITGVIVGEELDDRFFSPYDGLKRIGLVAEFEKLGDKWGVSANLSDVIIGFNAVGVEVLLEVPGHYFKEHISVKNAMYFGANMGVSMSILPPGHPLVDVGLTQDEYSEILNDFTLCLLENFNVSLNVMPISNYINYLMLEIILADKLSEVFKVEQEYILENYVKYMDEKDSDEFKARLKSTIYGYYENRGGFVNVANTLLQEIYGMSKEMFRTSVINYIEKQKAEQAQPKSE